MTTDEDNESYDPADLLKACDEFPTIANAEWFAIFPCGRAMAFRFGPIDGPGDRGTADMVRRAKSAGIELIFPAVMHSLQALFKRYDIDG